MKFTLIGGAGFIGRNTAGYLMDHGHEVVVIDSLQDYHEGRRPVDLECDDLIVRRCGDIRAADVDGSDVVVHLASKTDYWPRYGEYIRNNCSELARFFEHRFEAGCFVLVSSQTVYGNAETPYRVEECNLQPVEHYGLSKLLQERICELLCPIPLFVIRPVIVLGPGQNGRNLYAGVVKNTVARLARGMRPMIYCTGEQRRSFVSVYDVAKYVELVGTEPDRCTRCTNGVSSEGPLTINDLVARIQQIMETDIEPVRNEFVRKNDLPDCTSVCERPDLFGPAATGPALVEYVESLLASELPTAEEIEGMDRLNERLGVIKRNDLDRGSNLEPARLHQAVR